MLFRPCIFEQACKQPPLMDLPPRDLQGLSTGISRRLTNVLPVVPATVLAAKDTRKGDDRSSGSAGGSRPSRSNRPETQARAVDDLRRVGSAMSEV
jgi:hypothetical protein